MTIANACTFRNPISNAIHRAFLIYTYINVSLNLQELNETLYNTRRN